jgi:hypothetical protein
MKIISWEHGFCTSENSVTFIPADSCHPNEHKQSTIKFLKHRNSTYLTTPENKLQEETIIKHVLRANQYNTSTTNRTTNNHNCDRETKKPNRWDKFTFAGREVRAVTNLFRRTNVGVAFNTAHTVERMLSPTHHQQQSNRYSKSGVYALICSQYQKRYIGQTVSHSSPVTKNTCRITNITTGSHSSQNTCWK